MLEHEIGLRAYDLFQHAERQTDMRSMIGFRLSSRYYARRGLWVAQCQANVLPYR